MTVHVTAGLDTHPAFPSSNHVTVPAAAATALRETEAPSTGAGTQPVPWAGPHIISRDQQEEGAASRSAFGVSVTDPLQWFADSLTPTLTQEAAGLQANVNARPLVPVGPVPAVPQVTAGRYLRDRSLKRIKAERHSVSPPAKKRKRDRRGKAAPRLPPLVHFESLRDLSRNKRKGTPKKSPTD